MSERTPVFRNISISNVTVSGAPVVADIQGLPEMPIAGLRIRDLVGAGKRGLQAFNTKGLELHDVKIDAAEGPAFLIRDSSDLELDRVETDQGRTGDAGDSAGSSDARADSRQPGVAGNGDVSFGRAGIAEIGGAGRE